MDADAPIPLPAATAHEQRLLFARPDLVAAHVDVSAWAPALELARALSGAERVGLRLSGQERAAGTLDPPADACRGERTLGGEPAWVEPLTLSLLPEGEGPTRAFGAVAFAPAPPSPGAAAAARHVAWSLLRDALQGLLTRRAARDVEHVEALLEAVGAVTRLAPLEETLRLLVDRCVTITGAERGLLLERAGEGWRPSVARDHTGADLAAPDFASSVASEARAAGAAVHHVLEPEGTGAISPSADALALRAVLCAPLVGEDVPDAVVYVDSREASRFDPSTLAVFGALVAQLTTALRNAALHDRLRGRHQRLRADLAGREQELSQVRRLLRDQRLGDGSRAPAYGELLGRSPAMQQVFDALTQLEASDVPVVIEGESGTGKELTARAIHARSRRAAGPWVAVNAAAIPAALFESELFGHVRGAFTGATADRVGLIEEADGGTLFLDEVGELSRDAQAKLLRVIQEGEVRRVGDAQPRQVDVRVLTATHRDLRALVEQGAFREDLYYRLAVFRLRLPPLRERTGDLALLCEHLLVEARGRGVPTATLSPAALQALGRRPWPGNVRQLRNALERAATLAEGRIEPEHLADDDVPLVSGLPARGRFLPLREARTLFSLLHARRAVEQAQGSIAAAARALGISRQTLYRTLAEGEALEQELGRGDATVG